MDRYYFDHNATTPVSPEVIQATMGCLAEVYGNASSIHYFGQLAKQRLELARRQMAALVGAQPQEIVFTSGGTEADNLAIFGIVRHATRPQKHMVTTTIEHPAVLNACAQLEREGVAVTYVRVGGERRGGSGRRTPRSAAPPCWSSVMHANNELGTVQPIAEIARIAHEAARCLHSDGVQAAGKIPVNVAALGVDLYSISGHKIYAPKGIGALYVHKGTRMRPILFGGTHERERAAGHRKRPRRGGAGLRRRSVHRSTVCGSRPAARAARSPGEQASSTRVPDAGVNGARAPRTPNTTNICFDGIEGEALVIALDLKGFAVSSGSACSSGAVEPSHVLLAMGLTPERARASIRFSLGRSNTIEEVDALIDAVADSVRAFAQAFAGLYARA